jgi:hypothetical protein
MVVVGGVKLKQLVGRIADALVVDFAEGENALGPKWRGTREEVRAGGEKK